MIRSRRVGPNWRATLIAATSITLVNVLVLVWVTQRGWLGGTAFPKALGIRLGVYATMNLVFVMVPLAIYERVRRRSPHWALATYLAIVASFSLASIPVLRMFLARGIFVFVGPYSTNWDVAWGAVQYLAVLGIYRWLVTVTR